MYWVYVYLCDERRAFTARMGASSVEKRKKNIIAQSEMDECCIGRLLFIQVQRMVDRWCCMCVHLSNLFAFRAFIRNAFKPIYLIKILKKILPLIESMHFKKIYFN